MNGEFYIGTSTSLQDLFLYLILMPLKNFPNFRGNWNLLNVNPHKMMLTVAKIAHCRCEPAV